MITLNEQGHYVVQIPEYGVYQDSDPRTAQPFASELDAQKWSDDFLANIAAQKAAEEAAAQATLAAHLHIDLVADKLRTMKGDAITLTATVKNGLGNVVDLNDDFAVPVEDEGGKVILIKLATFVHGVAVVSLKPANSGYYCITEPGINRRLPSGVYFGLPAPLSVTVYE